MDITIRKGTPTDTEPFIALLQQVWKGMEHKEWLFLDPPEEVREMMNEGKMALWTAWDGQKLAGAFDILLPGLDAYNYGYDLELEKDALLQVINMDTVAVHPDYRGMGLQRRLMEAAEGEIQKRGAHILLCTVHPDNQFSLNNFLKQGYTIQKRLPKYGSERYVLRKDLL